MRALYTAVAQVIDMYSGHNDLKQVTSDNSEELRIILPTIHYSNITFIPIQKDKICRTF